MGNNNWLQTGSETLRRCCSLRTGTSLSYQQRIRQAQIDYTRKNMACLNYHKWTKVTVTGHCKRQFELHRRQTNSLFFLSLLILVQSTTTWCTVVLTGAFKRAMVVYNRTIMEKTCNKLFHELRDTPLWPMGEKHSRPRSRWRTPRAPLNNLIRSYLTQEKTHAKQGTKNYNLKPLSQLAHDHFKTLCDPAFWQSHDGSKTLHELSLPLHAIFRSPAVASDF